MLTELYRFQTKGVLKIEQFDGRALLADDMGLGKTIQAWAWAFNFLPPNATIVIITPASLKLNWQREGMHHFNLRSEVLSGLVPHTSRLLRGRKYIINYDVLFGRKGQKLTWMQVLSELKPDLVICDECHYIKSLNTKRTKAVKQICKDAPHVIMISGTPLTNRPAELFPALNILHPAEFPSFSQYGWRYCSPKMTPWGMNYSGASNLDELHERLSNLCMIRRRKKDVLKQLPDKTRSVIPIDLSAADRKEYNKAEKEFISWLRNFNPTAAKKAERAEYLVKRGYLKRLAGSLKLNAVMEWIENFLTESDEKLIFFGIHKKFLQPIYQRFKEDAVLVNGSVNSSDRQKAFDAFTNQKKKRLFIGNIQAAGVGWNGQVASNVAFGEMGWTPGEHTQAEDRAHRIGQTRGVMCHYLVSAGTIEESLCKIIQEKQQTLTSILDGNNEVELDIMIKLNQELLKRKVK